MSLPAQTVRFGPFQLDLRAAELHHNGTKTKLPEQPFQILAELVEHPGEVVTREELRQRLWRSDTFVDFEHGLNAAVKRLREILGDSAENPRYIETLPRHGYRLMVPVEKPEPVAQAFSTESARRRTIWLVASALLLAAVAAGLVWRLRERLRPVKIESLAVLPLENLSGNPDEEYFADGMTQALITELGKVQALRVISWQSVKQYKATNKPVPQIAHELHVDALVEGSALRAGDKVRITTQLVQANPERHLWSESYQRDLRDILALQGDVARAITDEIKVKVTPQEHARLAGRRPVNPEAYRAYLRGGYYLEKRTANDIRKAIDSFQHAVEIDPDYAMGYAGLAEAYWLVGPTWGVLTGEESLAKAEAAATKALELDDTLGVPHALLAEIGMERDWDWAGGEKEFKHALELDPGNATVHYWYGFYYLVSVGRLDEAIAEMKRSLELAPLSLMINTNLGETFWFRDIVRGGTYDETIGQCRKTLELDSDFAPARSCLARAYAYQGRYDEAITGLSGCAAGGDVEYLRRLGQVYALSGKRTEALRLSGKVEEQYKEHPEEAYQLWLFYAALGDNDRAFAWLEKAYQQRDFNVRYVRYCTVDPACKQLSSDPRYTDLVRRMNFPSYEAPR
jgi:TolB-like protein/DNA-binding winged helix-turn-helix (wHTH) protein/cytochrome c-type biogenesis protein CcmH/NrfG